MRFLPASASILLLFLTIGSATAFLGGCSNARTEALQRRQNWYNDRSAQRDQRRAIRAQNMDERTGFTLPD